MEPILRAACGRDSGGLIRLIGGIFAEYPGCVMEVEREEAGLLAPHRSYNRFWVLEDQGRVAGCSACRIHRPDRGEAAAEVKKVYLHRALRGKGWGRKLIERAEAFALEEGIRNMVCWSDTRFQDAHRAYEALGYRRTGELRLLGDLSRSVEIGFRKELPRRPTPG